MDENKVKRIPTSDGLVTYVWEDLKCGQSGQPIEVENAKSIHFQTVGEYNTEAVHILGSLDCVNYGALSTGKDFAIHTGDKLSRIEELPVMLKPYFSGSVHGRVCVIITLRF